MLSFAWHAAWPPVKRAQGALNYFGNGHKNVFSQTTRLIRIKFGMKHQGSEALSVSAHRLDPPLQWGWGNK